MNVLINALVWLYIGIGIVYALLTFHKVRFATFYWHMLTNMVLWPFIVYFDRKRGWS